jgi:hypothetical protein
MNATAAGPLVGPHPPWPCHFWPTFAVLRLAPAPDHLRSRVHPLVSFAASSELSALVTCSTRARVERLPWGSSPPSRCEREQSDDRAVSTPPAFSAPSVSHALDGLFLLAPRGSVSPRYHVRGSLFRVFPGHGSPGSSPGRFPLGVGVALPADGVAPTAPASRRAAHRACTHDRSVAAGSWLRAAGSRSPLEFSLPRVFLRTPWTRLHGSSAREPGCLRLS